MSVVAAFLAGRRSNVQTAIDAQRDAVTKREECNRELDTIASRVLGHRLYSDVEAVEFAKRLEENAISEVTSGAFLKLGINVRRLVLLESRLFFEKKHTLLLSPNYILVIAQSDGIWSVTIQHGVRQYFEYVGNLREVIEETRIDRFNNWAPPDFFRD